MQRNLASPPSTPRTSAPLKNWFNKSVGPRIQHEEVELPGDLANLAAQLV